MYLNVKLINKGHKSVNGQSDITTIDALNHLENKQKGPLQSAIDNRSLADESHIEADDHPCLVFLDKPIDMKVKNVDSKDLYPWLDKDDPRRHMTDMQILKTKIKLDDSILNEKQKLEFYQMIDKNKDIFSIRDKIGTCPQIQVHLKLRDETPFFVRPYPIHEEQKVIVKREMDRLVHLGIIKKGLTGYSSPVLLVKRKQQNLFHVCTDFRVLNDRLVRINHAFPVVRGCIEGIGKSNCQVMSILDLRYAYHTL